MEKINEDKRIEEIKKTLDKIRPYIQRDGGDVEFKKLENDVVYVSVHGACIGCGLISFTLKDGVEALIKDEVEGIKSVELYNEDLGI